MPTSRRRTSPSRSRSKVYQLTCSPLHNYVPAAMKVAFRIAWSRAAARSTRALLGRTAPVPPASLAWTRLSGPYFGNEIGELTLTGRRAEMALHRSAPASEPRQLLDLDSRVLSG